MSARPAILLLASTALGKALEPGDRWITVHPHGPGSDGQAVLIHPAGDGSFKVVGGAGGSLNHLRLTGIKPQSEYAETLRERAKERRSRAAAQRQRDKALGLSQKKAEAHARVQEKTHEARQQFVAGVAEAMGWDKADLEFDAAKVAAEPDHVVAKLREAHERDLLKRAEAAVGLNRARILGDVNAAAEAELGEVPLEADAPDVVSVQDLDPVRTEPVGLGFAPDYKGRAEAAGAGEEEVKAEAQDSRPEPTEAKRKAQAAASETARKVREGLELLRDPDDAEKLRPKLIEAKKALELLKLEKKRRLAEQAARAEHKRINESVIEPKAAVIEVDDAKVDAKVAEDIANDLRTISTRAFLSEVAKTAPDPMKSLGKHVGSGAYNSVNALALAAGGDALVDRSVVDVLGVAGAAEVLARRLATDLEPEEFKTVAEAMQDFHLHHYMEASKEAIAQANELREEASEIELGAAETGHDLAAMQEINRRRGEAIAESQKVLGTALGEMEANAALVYALGRGKSDKPFQVSLGDTPVESAIRQVRAIGLERGDYTLETAGGNRVLTVLPGGLDRLARPVNRGDLEQVRRNLDIISGGEDEDGWLPEGITDRPDLDLHVKPGAAPSLATPFDPGADLEQSVRDYIGGRTADGDRPADILSDLQSADFMRKVGSDRIGEYRAVLDRLAPLEDETGKLRQAESMRDGFEAMADAFVEARYGAARTPLHKQDIPVDDTSAEALHRALAEEPAGVAAYKQIGELTPQDQGALREFFAKNVARESPEAAKVRGELAEVEAAEPERETEDMFGDRVTNPEWSEWRGRRDDLRAKVNAGSITWSKYVEAMRGPEHAYSAVQDLVRSRVNDAFAGAYNRLRPDAPVKLGRATIRENLNHLDATHPKARDARLAHDRALTDSLRERVAGRYASGSVQDKLQAAREEEAGLDAAQLGFFADEPEAAEARPLDADERHSLGVVAERRIAEMMPQVGANFRPGQPVKLFRPSMSGGKNRARQRAIKLIAANKRAVLSFGTGAGKTLIGLGAFTHLHAKGEVKRGLFLCPSIAQGGFGAEALRFLKPGAYKWHAKPGATREERIAAYKDPANHFCVMTHQAFRDDMLHLGAQHAGIDEAQMSGQLAGMSREERQDWLRGVMRREGIGFDYLNVDEGHDTLDRKGKPDSTLANVVDALGDTAPYYANASADPIKNDVSEAFSLLQKMDPARYTDRAAFMRRYGVDTMAAKDSLRRELARFQYPSKIDPDVTASRIERKVDLAPETRTRLADLDRNVASARLARMQGKVDVAAMKAIDPSAFEGVPAEEHEALAGELQKTIGLVRNAAVKRVLEADAGGLDQVVSAARERPGKQGVVFAHSLASVEAIRSRLTAEGLRVATITGKDSAKVKAARINQFRPQNGEPEADVMVASDAGATGANLQSGQWLVNFDTPETAKTHAQRNGRINRTGQTQDVDLIDVVRNHPDEHRRRDRLARKYALREMMTTPMESLDDTGVAWFLRQRQAAKDHGGLL